MSPVTVLSVAAGAVALAFVVCSQPARSDDRAPADLTSRLKAAELMCKRGDVRACQQVSLTMGELNSRGFCYGKKSDTLDWERRKTGWVRCR